MARHAQATQVSVTLDESPERLSLSIQENGRGISAKTISTNRARILQKMALKTNADLIHYAIQHHLIEDRL